MSLPVGAHCAAPVPHGRTARRLTWEHLPPALRSQIEQRLGSTVTAHASQDAGFTPGFASVLTGADGAQVFVKAASRSAQKPFANAYAAEARMLQRLGEVMPAPRLLWTLDEEWVVLGIEAVPHRRPERPWTESDLTRALGLVEEIAASAQHAPRDLSLAPLHLDQPLLVQGWRRFAATEPRWPHLAQAAALAQEFPLLKDGLALVHGDLRDDNVLLCSDGRTLACDWNWPALAPAWVDVVGLLAIAHGDGVEVEDHLASHPLTRHVAPEAIDAWLAAWCGFMLAVREHPSPSSSPYVQTHAYWTSEAIWEWLAQRRGWDDAVVTVDLGAIGPR